LIPDSSVIARSEATKQSIYQEITQSYPKSEKQLKISISNIENPIVTLSSRGAKILAKLISNPVTEMNVTLSPRGAKSLAK